MGARAPSSTSPSSSGTSSKALPSRSTRACATCSSPRIQADCGPGSEKESGERPKLELPARLGGASCLLYTSDAADDM
eukprot:7116654-Alexandrium_andersonii.AAC.1